MSRLSKKEGSSGSPHPQLSSSLKNHGSWSVGLFLGTVLFHFLSFPAGINLIAMAICWFLFSIIFGIFLGYGFLWLINFQGNPYPRNSRGDLIVRVIMGVTFFVFFIGGIGLYSKLTG